MNRHALSTIAGLFLVFGVVAFADDSPSNRDVGLRVVGYLPDYRVDQIDPTVGKNLTDVVFFSVTPERDGKFVSKALNSPKAIELLKRFREEHHLNVILCVGGWNRSKGFAEIAATPASRKRFATGLTSFCQTHGFAGADLDWEHPKDNTEATNYGLLLAEISQAFKPHQLRLTAAMAGWQTLTKEGIDAVDAIHLMSYDGNGKHSTLDMAKADVQKFLDAGVPAAKIRLGLPFYGRGVSDKNRVKTYAEIVALDPKSLNSDEVDGLYFNGPTTIKAKIQFARDKHLGGVMIWEIGQDAKGEHSLLKAIGDAIRSGTGN